MLGLLRAKRVMGIDASTNSMAFSVFKGKRLWRWGIVYFEGKELNDRLVDARKKLESLMDLYNVDVVVMEKAVYVQNKVSFAALAKMFGVVQSVVGEKAEFHELTPTTWYKVIGNNGMSKIQQAQFKKDYPGKSLAWYKAQFREERKNMTKRWVTRTFKIIVEDDNVCDAIGLGFAGVDLIKRK